MGLNLQIPFQAPQITMQGFQALGQGVQDFMAKQEEKRKEAEILQYENVKNQTIVQNLAKHGMLTPEQMLEFQSAAPKKQKSLAEGYAATVAFDIMQRQQGQTKETNRIQNAGREASTALDVERLNQIQNPAPVPPIQAQPVPGAPNMTAITGGGLKQPKVISAIDADGKPKLVLSDAELAEGRAAHKIPLRQSNGSFVWADDPSHVGEKDGDTFSRFGSDVTAFQKIMEAGQLRQQDIDVMQEQFQKRLAGLTGTTKKSAAGPDGGRTLGEKDQAMLDWALANPDNETAKKIKAKLLGTP